MLSGCYLFGDTLDVLVRNTSLGPSDITVKMKDPKGIIHKPASNELWEKAGSALPPLPRHPSASAHNDRVPQALGRKTAGNREDRSARTSLLVGTRVLQDELHTALSPIWISK